MEKRRASAGGGSQPLPPGRAGLALWKAGVCGLSPDNLELHSGEEHPKDNMRKGKEGGKNRHTGGVRAELYFSTMFMSQSSAQHPKCCCTETRPVQG